MLAKSANRDDEDDDDDDDDEILENSNDGKQYIYYLFSYSTNINHDIIEAENGLAVPKKKSEKAKWIPAEVSNILKICIEIF